MAFLHADHPTRNASPPGSPGRLRSGGARLAASATLLVVVVRVLLGLLEPVDKGLSGVAHLLARLVRVRVRVRLRVRIRVGVRVVVAGLGL